MTLVHLLRNLCGFHTAGGLAGALGVFFVFLQQCQSWISAALASWLWLLAVLLIGKLPVVLWFLSKSRRPPPDPELSWTRALWGGLGALFVSAWLLGCIVAPLFAGPPILLCYAAGKLDCNRLGCCNWRLRTGPRGVMRTLSLPLFEAIASLALATLTLIVQQSGEPSAAFGLFLLGHGALRVASKAAQRQHWLGSFRAANGTALPLLAGAALLSAILL